MTYFDANVYVGEWPFRSLDASAAAVIERMNKHDIDRGVVSALQAPMYKNPQTANRELVDDLDGYEDRFVPFATLDPTYPDALGDLEESVSELGMRGVRLFPAYHDYLLSADPVIELAEACADRELPLMICAVLQDQRQRHPRVKLRAVGRKSYSSEQVDALIELLLECPETDIIIGDVRGNLDRIATAVEPHREGGWIYNMDRDGDLYFTVDGLGMRHVAEAEDVLDAVDPDQLVFGTRLPLDYPSERAILKLEHLDVAPAQRAAIESETLASLLD